MCVSQAIHELSSVEIIGVCPYSWHCSHCSLELTEIWMDLSLLNDRIKDVYHHGLVSMSNLVAGSLL